MNDNSKKDFFKIVTFFFNFRLLLSLRSSGKKSQSESTYCAYTICRSLEVLEREDGWFLGRSEVKDGILRSPDENRPSNNVNEKGELQ